MIALLTDRRMDPNGAGEPRIILTRQHDVMRACLAGDVDTARLGFAQRTKLFRRRYVQDVDACSRPFRKQGGAAYRFDCNDRRTRGKMGKRIEAPCPAQPCLAPLHDGVRLGMERNALAGGRHNLECFQHGASRRAWDPAEGVSHVELESDYAAGDQRGDVRDGVLAEQSVKPEIDMRLLGSDAVLCGERFGGAGRGDGAWDVS